MSPPFRGVRRPVDDHPRGPRGRGGGPRRPHRGGRHRPSHPALPRRRRTRRGGVGRWRGRPPARDLLHLRRPPAIGPVATVVNLLGRPGRRRGYLHRRRPILARHSAASALGSRPAVPDMVYTVRRRPAAAYQALPRPWAAGGRPPQRGPVVAGSSRTTAPAGQVLLEIARRPWPQSGQTPAGRVRVAVAWTIAMTSGSVPVRDCHRPRRSRRRRPVDRRPAWAAAGRPAAGGRGIDLDDQRPGPAAARQTRLVADPAGAAVAGFVNPEVIPGGGPVTGPGCGPARPPDADPRPITTPLPATAPPSSSRSPYTIYLTTTVMCLSAAFVVRPSRTWRIRLLAAWGAAAGNCAPMTARPGSRPARSWPTRPAAAVPGR